jgi:hypothetical protein
MKHRAPRGLMAWSLGLLAVVGFACLDAGNIPPISDDLRDALAATYGNGAAPPVASAGTGGSAAAPIAGAGGNAGSGAGGEDEPPAEQASGGAAGSSMAGVAGSSADQGAAGSAPASETCDGFAILAQYCATSGCHGQPGAPLGDFASGPDAARAFIGREGSLACTGQGVIIDSDEPSDSLLLAKISGDPPCGQAMPPTGEQLTDAQVACIQEWIGGL